MKKTLFFIAAALAFASCGGNQHKASDPLTDSGRTQRTETLLENLKAIGDSSVYMFGHHDDTVYGIGWEADYENDSTIGIKSDVKSVCNDLPAVLSFDLGNIESGDDKNLNGVPFSRIRKEAINHFDHGGLVTLSWHPEKQDADKVADFLNTLETPYGVKVPVVLRLLHATKDEWRKTVERMKKQGITNVLYAYSSGNTQDYMEHYPGDDIIDLLGLDLYCNVSDGDTLQVAAFAEALDKQLVMISQIAKERGKTMALTETGYEGIKTKDWWTKTLAPVLARHPICYVLVGRNAHNTPTHYFAPYPGQSSTSDFVKFYNLQETLFLHDVNGLYLKKEKH